MEMLAERQVEGGAETVGDTLCSVDAKHFSILYSRYCRDTGGDETLSDMEAKLVVETLAHTYLRIEAEKLKDTQIQVEAEALLDVLAHTLEIKAENFLRDSG